MNIIPETCMAAPYTPTRWKSATALEIEDTMSVAVIGHMDGRGLTSAEIARRHPSIRLEHIQNLRRGDLRRLRRRGRYLGFGKEHDLLRCSRRDEGGIEAQGIGTMPAGQTSVVINHGMTVAPTLVSVTQQGNFGNVNVQAITSTSFTVNFGVALITNYTFLQQASALKR